MGQFLLVCHKSPTVPRFLRATDTSDVGFILCLRASNVADARLSCFLLGNFVPCFLVSICDKLPEVPISACRVARTTLFRGYLFPRRIVL